MNCIYSLVWNRALLTLQVASEITGATGGGSKGCVATSLRKHALALACIAALTMAAFAAPVRAQTPIVATWGSISSGGSWATASRWQCTPVISSCVPNDSASNFFSAGITTPSPVTINFDANPTTIDTLLVGGLATLQDDTTASGYPRYLTIGDSSSNNIFSGQLINSGTIHWDGGGILTINPTGSSAKINNIGTIDISDAHLQVNGDFAENNGTLTIGNDALATITGMLTSAGTINVMGGTLDAQAVTTSGDLTIGPGGLLGTLSEPAIFNISGGTTTVMVGGGLNATRFTQTGGTVTVQTGGTVTAHSWDIEHGTANVQGQVLTLTPPTGTMTVGGNLNLDQGSAVDVMGNVAVSSPCTTDAAGVISCTLGSIKVDDSALNVSGNTVNNGEFTVMAGSSMITGGNLVTNGSVLADANSALIVGGNLSVNSTGNVTITDIVCSLGACGQPTTLTVAGTTTNSGDISLTPSDYCAHVPAAATPCGLITIQQLQSVYNSGSTLDKVIDTFEFIGQTIPALSPGDIAELADPPSGSPPVSAGVDFNNLNGGSVELAAAHDYLLATGNYNNDAGSSLILNGGNDRVVPMNAFINGGAVTLSGTGDAIVTPTFTNTGTVSIGAGEAIAIKTLVLGTAGTVNATSYSQSAGSTDVNGTLFAPAVNISGGKLSGTGLIASLPDTLGGNPNPTVVTVTGGGTLIPGEQGAPGTLTINGSLGMYGTLDIGIDGTGSGQFGVLDVTGTATFGADSIFKFMFGDGFDGAAGDTFQFFDASSFLNFNDVLDSFSSARDCSGLMAGLGCMLSMNGAGDGLLLTLNGTSAHGVPEPGSLGMMGLGLLLLGGGLGWRKPRERKEV